MYYYSAGQKHLFFSTFPYLACVMVVRPEKKKNNICKSIYINVESGLKSFFATKLSVDKIFLFLINNESSRQLSGPVKKFFPPGF